MLESELEKRLKKEVRALGGMCLKWVSPSMTGVPDDIVICDGHIYLVELKTETGKLSKRQEYVHREINKAGVIVYTLHGLREVLRFVDGLRTTRVPAVRDKPDS